MNDQYLGGPGLQVFLSYRRSDAGGHAGRLFDRLSHWFDADTLFYDRQTIGIGEVFPDVIQAALDRAAVVLVLIGPNWLSDINARITQPGIDFVRHEVAQALAARARGVNVIPVIMNDALMPSPDQLDPALHDQIAALCRINAHKFVGVQADWDNQFIRLLDCISATPGMPKPRYLPPAGEERPWRVIDHTVSLHFQDPNGLLPQLHTQLETSGRTALVAPATLFGMGGVGKTQLALKYCFDYRDRYAGVWCLRAETETTLQLDALDCCTAVGAPINPNELPTVALKRWLTRQSTPWLLVFDNAESSETLRPHLPQGGPHRIVITSRSPTWNGVAHALALTAWSPEQGAAFLAERLPGCKPDELHALSKDLGGLPLALEQAAGYLESNGMAIAEYRRLLADVNTEGLILDEGRAATGYERTVLATLSLAFDKLSPAATQLLGLLAYAAPEPLLERFLREAAEKLPAELAAAANSETAWNRLIKELRGYGLAERSQQTHIDDKTHTEPALHLHRLTQQVLRARLADPTRDGAILQAVLWAVCPTDIELPAHWPRYAALLPHIVQLDRYLDAGLLDRDTYSWLLNCMAAYLQFGLGLYDKSILWYRRALEINREDFGDKHPKTLATMGNLACALKDKGDLTDARSLQEEVFVTSVHLLGEEHPGTLVSMNTLANTLLALGDLNSARELQELGLTLRQHLYGGDDPATLTTMHNLANVLHAQRDLVGALNLQKSVLEKRRHVLGENHPATLKSMNNIACIMRDQGDLIGALDLQKSALGVQHRMLGNEHPDTAIAAFNLFVTAIKLQDSTTAIEVFEPFLLPLLQADPVKLGDDLRRIRQDIFDSRDHIQKRTGVIIPTILNNA